MILGIFATLSFLYVLANSYFNYCFIENKDFHKAQSLSFGSLVVYGTILALTVLFIPYFNAILIIMIGLYPVVHRYAYFDYLLNRFREKKFYHKQWGGNIYTKIFVFVFYTAVLIVIWYYA